MEFSGPILWPVVVGGGTVILSDRIWRLSCNRTRTRTKTTFSRNNWEAMMPFIILTERTQAENDIWVNSDLIVSMKRYEAYTHIYTTGVGENYPHTISVLETPEQIDAKVKEAKG
jgi:hypothetical protein